MEQNGSRGGRGDPAGSDDATLRAAAEFVDPPLLAALAQATGDRSVLRDGLRPDLSLPFDPANGWTPDMRAEAVEVAGDALLRWRDAGCPSGDPPSIGQLRPLMEFSVGGPLSDEYLPVLYEELGGEGDDPRAPAWTVSDLAPGRPFRVVVVGAGMSGLIAAHRLGQAGIEHVVLEKNADVGGTWFENTYPGCRVDIPNHFYSYSFAQKDDWPDHFSSQEVLLDYFRDCADGLGLRDRIRFGTEVVAARFDEDRCRWTVEVITPDGADRIEADAVVFAVGQLNRPHLPPIDGIGSFAGPSFHSARWDHRVDLAGKRVAVVGTGASAAQLVPRIAEEAAHLLVFQRTPNWLLPAPDYQAPIPPGKLWLFRHVPAYHQWYRFWLFYRLADGLLPATEVDPDWEDHRAVGAVNDLARQFMTAYLEEQFGGRPDLLARVVPDYPPFAKRMVLDNGGWAAALTRPNVTLVDDEIVGIRPRGVVTAGGEHEVDVVVYATGFEASDFLAPVRVTGRGGVELHEMWHGDARAYLGLCVPGFPNLFCLYGPNTNIVVSGSIIYFSECGVRYVLACLERLIRDGAGALDVRPEVHARYNEAVDRGNSARAWGASTVNSWYKNATGRVSQNWPFSLQEYWQRTLRPDPAEFELLAARATAPSGGGGEAGTA